MDVKKQKKENKMGQMLRLDAVKNKMGLSRSTIYNLIKNDKFPLPLKIGAASLWSESEIDDYLGAKLRGRKKTQNEN